MFKKFKDKQTDDPLTNSAILPSFQQMVESAFDGVWVVDTQFRTTYVNQRLCDLLGFTKQELLKKNIIDLLFEEDMSDHAERVKNRTNKKSEQYERRLKRKDGSEVWMIVSANPLSDADGNFAGSFATYTDITEQKHRDRITKIYSETQTKLAQLEDIDQVYLLVGEKIREMINTGFVGTTVVDEKAKTISISQIFGIGQSFYDLVKKFNINPFNIKYPLKDASSYELGIFQAGKLQRFEGGLYPLLMRKIPKGVCKVVEKQLEIQNIMIMGLVSEGTHFGGIVILTKEDVSSFTNAIETLVFHASQVIQRLRSEMTLRISDDRLRLTFDAINDGYWDWDLPSGEVTANDKWFTMLGYDPGEFKSTYQKFKSLIHPEDYALTVGQIDKVITCGEDFSAEVRLRMKNGSYKWVQSRGKIIAKDKTGVALRMVGTHTDISERKHTEEDKLLFYDTQRKLVQVTNFSDLYDLIGNSLVKLLGDGYAVFTRFDQFQQVIKVVGFYGFGKNVEDFYRTFKMSNSSFDVRREDIEDKNLQLWNSNTLVQYHDGIYGILTKKLPKTICREIEKRLSINEIHVMGAKWNEQNYGGFVLLTKNGLGQNKELIETLINDASIAIQRITTEEEVLIAQKRYRNVFEKSPVGIVTLGADFKYLTVNTEYCNICGYSKEELLHLTFKEITHPDYIKPEVEQLNKLIAGEIEVYSTVKKYVHKDGRSVWGKLIVNRICDHEGKFLYLLAMVTNIDKEMIAEEAIRENRHFLEMVLDTIPNLVFVRDNEGRYRLANKAFAEAMGSTTKEIIGKTNHELGDSIELSDEVNLQDLEIISSGKDWINTDMEMFFPGQGKKFVQFVKRSLPIAEHKKPAILGVLTDTSERKQFEQELVEKEFKYRTLFESMRQGAFYQNADGTIMDANPSALEIFGLTREQFAERLNGRTEWRVLDENGNYQQLSSRPSQIALLTGKPVYEKTISFYNPQKGQDVWVVINAIPQFHENEKKPYQVYVTVHDITKLKEIEKELRISELRYRTLIENSPMAVYQTDTEGKTTYVNDRFCEMNGLTKEEAAGDGWFTSVHPEDHDRVLRLWNSFIKTGGTWSHEYRLQNKKTGQIVWVVDEAVALLDEDGKKIGYIGSSFDLSEQKKAEAELRRSEEKYRLLTENMKDVIWTLDTETLKFTYMSPSVENLRGFTAEEVLSSPLSAALTEKGAESFVAIINQQIEAYKAKLLSSEKYFTYDIPQPKKDGTMVWTEVITSLHLNPDTGHLDLHGVTRDITQRKNAEEALQKSEEKHRLLIENSHDIIYTLSTKGDFTFVSNAWSVLLGIPIEKTIGSPFYQFVHLDDSRKCSDFFKKIIETKERQSGLEYRVKHADGSWLWYTSSGLPIFDQSGNCIGIEGTARDISERKLAEEALLESEERYRLLVEQSPVGIMLAQKGKFIYANKAGLKLFGYKDMGEFTGTNVLKTIHSDSQKALFKRILDITRGKSNPLMEIKIIKKNGEVCETESTSSQIRLKGEIATLIFAQDISARKKADLQIQKNTDDLTLIRALNDSVNRGDSLQTSLGYLIESAKRIFSSNGAAVYLLDPDNEYLEMQHFQINEEIMNWIEDSIRIKIPKVKIKLTPQSLYRQILVDKKFRLLEGRDYIIQLMTEFTENPAFKKMIPSIYKRVAINSVIAIPLISHDESVGLLELSSKTSFAPEDVARLEFISSELGSIIRRKQAEEALKESEEKFRQIIEKSNDIFIRQNYANLNFEYVSPNVIYVLGYTQDEILNLNQEHINELIHPEDRSLFESFRRSLQTGLKKSDRTFVREFRILNIKGDYIWLNGNYSLVLDENENPKLIIGTLSDITSRKINESILNFRVKFMQLAQELELDELLAAILDEIESLTNSKFGFYNFINEDQKTINKMVWSTNTIHKTTANFRNSTITADATQGVWQNSINERKALICNDLSSSGSKKKLPTGHPDISREMIIPVVRNEKVVSILGFFNKTSEYTPNELEYISTLADLSWDIIEHKKIEGALQESEAIFNAFMENSPIYVFFKDKEIRSKQLSRNYEQMLGQPLEKLLHKNMYELFPSELAKEMVEDDKKILHDGQTVVVDEELNDRFYTTIKFPIFKNGKPEFLAGFTIDITDRVLSEKKLAESEELYRLISSVVSDYLFSTKINSEGNLDLIWVAGAFEAMTGYSLAEYKAIGGWRTLVHPDDLQIDDRDMENLRNNKKVISELRTIKKDGCNIWVQIYAQPIWDEERKQLVGINGAVQDISKRKQVEEEIKKAAIEFEALYETAKDFSMHRDPFIILRTISDRACSLFGVSSAFVYLFNPDTKELELKFSKDPLQRIGSRIKLGEGISGIAAQKLTPMIVDDYDSWPNKLPDYEGTNLAATMCVPMMYGGQLIGVLGVQEKHPSEHKFTESDAHFLSLFASQAAGAVYSADLFEKLRINASELEKRVDERTKELQLKNKELETFTYTVSHDLKAPLRGISGYSTLLMEDHAEQLDEEGKRYLGNLVSSTERMNLLIEDLLAYSRIERRELKKTNVNLNELLDKIIMEYQPEVSSGNLQFKKEIEYDTLFTDNEAISQALRNIIDNAVKFTKGREKPEILIQCNKLEDHYLISIEDNGIGFDMKYYDKIFEIFQRLHLSEEYPGTGVGLAVVRKAIERLGGKIWAVSEPGVGSTFFMELPL